MKLKSDGFIVHCIKSLTEKGFIKKGDTPRSIKLLPVVEDRLRTNVTKIPVLGHVPAGGAVVSEENVEDWVSLDFGAGQPHAKHFQNPGDCFVLRVRGDSMVDAGVFEGDFVVCAVKLAPKKDDIVVALVDGGSTVKRYMLKDGKPYLKPENSKYSAIYPESELQIQGVVVGLIRWY